MKFKMENTAPEIFLVGSTEFKYQFAKAKKSIDISVVDLHSDDTIVEEKYDGSRFGAVINTTGIELLSRNNINRATNVPYIIEEIAKKFPKGTILDGEIVHLFEPRKIRWELARSVVGTNEFSNKIIRAQYLIFDIQFFDGKDLKGVPFEERRKLLETVIPIEGDGRDGHLYLPKQFKLNEAKEVYNEIIKDGGEGIMLKSPKELYAKSWTKVKKVFTIDCFVMGIEKGKGKYTGQVGSLILGVMRNGLPFKIGKTSGMTDKERKEFTEMALAKQLNNMVIEVKANEVTKNYQLRHPRFIRKRDDKSYNECSFEQLKHLVK